MTRSKLLEAVAGGDVSRVAAMLHPDTALNPPQGTTPLYRAAVLGHAEIVRLLLEYGADPDQPSGGAGEGLPLCAAACWDHAETVQALVDGGADPDAAEAGGWTALLWAAADGHLASADILLDAGADPDRADDDGDTPLALAAHFGAYGIVWSLLEHGADPRLPGADGVPPLEIASRWAAADLEEVLRAEALAQAGGDRAEGDRTEGDRTVSGCTVLVTRRPAPDGTRLVTVEARPAGGGGHTVTRQCGHVAIVTILEMALGARPRARELLARVLPYRDLDTGDETWWAAVHALRRRPDDETFAEAAGLCDGEDAAEREFGADVLAEFGRDCEKSPFHERSLRVLRDMAREEHEPRVIDAVLHALAHHADERALPEVLAAVARQGRTPTVAAAVALAAVLPPGDEDGLAALVRLSECADDEVRDWATMGIAGLGADTPGIREALAARLTDRDLTTVAEAALGLAGRGDHRAIHGVHRVLCPSSGAPGYARDLAVEAAQELGLEIGVQITGV
ncbi:ankyrin repeat domain-containing protein [Microbispora sp. NPDC049125]|uniref:ankyrin repeat domain-containing protein n=1 Tax=Microbispora sp. NPDC049125 TaxID=3154929 RepID=UPI003466A543